MAYRPEVDGLRALAVLPVVLFHAGLEPFSGGYVGVDVFFVISGYLIISLILAEKQDGSFSLARFYERRARRIFPALFLVMLICTPLAWLWFTPGDAEAYSQSVIFTSLFASNVFFWQQVGYFDTSSEVNPLLHTWSLGIEEQFYLLFPPFLLLAWRLGVRTLLVLLAVAAVASLALAEWGSVERPSATFYLLPTRGWELLLGGLIAFHHQQRGRSGRDKGRLARIHAEVGGLAGLALIAASVVLLDADTPFPGLFALPPTLGAALIILFAHPGTLAGRFLSSRVMVGVGLISYSLYLWHLPLFTFARYGRVPEPPATVFLALSCLAVLLAFASWRYVERPFRKRDRIRTRQIAGLSAATVLVLVTAGTVGHQTNGFLEQKLNPVQRHMLETAASSPRSGCDTTGSAYLAPAEACEYLAPEVRWAVLGDSHAVNLAYAMAESLKARGEGVKHLSNSGCSPSYGQAAGRGDHCVRWHQDAVDYLIDDRRIHTVVVTYRMNLWLFGEHEGEYPDLPHTRSPAERQAVWRSLRQAIQALEAAGKRVVYVMQPPELKTGVESLIYRHGAAIRTIPGSDRGWWARRNAYVASRKGELARHASVIDPTERFCDTENCYAVVDGFARYMDDDHLSVIGARQVATQILESTTPRCRAGCARATRGVGAVSPAAPLSRHDWRG